MAVKRLIKNRLEKVFLAGETEAISNTYLETLIRNVITIGPTDPVSVSADFVLNGFIWRNTNTNPDTWSIRENDSWVSLLASGTEHGLLNRIDYLKLQNIAVTAIDDTIVQRDDSAGIEATKFNSVSARRHKTNITPIENASELISELEGVRFNWKKDGIADIGMIADDADEFIPELVHKDKDGNIEGIAYDHIVAILIEGFKEQQSKIDKILNHLGLDNE